MNQAQRSSLKGTLHLVDLAGSERLSRSNATGDRLKETVAINKSLSSLTDVFVSISNKSSHVSLFADACWRAIYLKFYFLPSAGCVGAWACEYTCIVLKLSLMFCLRSLGYK